MNIELKDVGFATFRQETLVCFEIDGKEYSFTLIETGSSISARDSAYEFQTEEELPFELTKEMTTWMYSLVCDVARDM